MRKSPARVLYGLFGAKPSWIALAQNSLRSLDRGRKASGGRREGGRREGGGKERRCTFRIRCIRLSVAENNARCLAKHMREPWRLASRIMLSVRRTLYALYARLPRGNRVASFIAPQPPLCEINRVVRKRGSLAFYARATRYRKYRLSLLYATISRKRERISQRGITVLSHGALNRSNIKTSDLGVGQIVRYCIFPQAVGIGSCYRW